MRRRLTAATVAAVVLLLAACDQSGTFGPTGTPEAMTRAVAAYAGPTTDAHTIELWARLPNAAASDAPCTADGEVVLTGVSKVAAFFPYVDARWVVAVAADGDLWFGYRDGTTTPNVDPVADPVCADLPAAGLRDGTWHHVAVQRTATTGAVALFVDGARVAQGTTPTGLIGGGAGTNVVTVGGPPSIAGQVVAASATAERFVGQVDEVRISTTHRYAGGGFAVPTERFAPDDAAAGLWHFNGVLTGADRYACGHFAIVNGTFSSDRCIPNEARGLDLSTGLAVDAPDGVDVTAFDSPFA